MLVVYSDLVVVGISDVIGMLLLLPELSMCDVGVLLPLEYVVAGRK